MTSKGRDVRYGRRGGGWVEERGKSVLDDVIAADQAEKAARRARPVDDERDGVQPGPGQLDLFGDGAS